MGRDPEHIDRWILSKLQHRIRETNDALDLIRTRHALQNSFFLLYNDIKWYQRRGGSTLLYDVLDTWVRLLVPFTPHLCEDIWETMGHGSGDFASLAAYPVYDAELVDREAEFAEELVSGTLSDIEEIVRVTKMSPRKVILYTSQAWKREVYKLAVSMQGEGSLNAGILIKTLMSDPAMRLHGKEVPAFVKKLIPNITGMSTDALEIVADFDLDEEAVLKEASVFLAGEVGCPVEVYSADAPDYDPENKSRFAVPLRPAIYLEK